MKITVERKWSDSDSTVSEVMMNGQFLCYGLEDAIREIEGQPVEKWKVHGKTAIPYGTYEVEITYSNRFKKDMLQIMDVPGFAGIRIHAGNTEHDTEGCLLVGANKDLETLIVFNCKPALVKLFGAVQAALHHGERVTIEFKKG